MRIVTERDADARVDLDLPPLDLEWLRQREMQPLGDAGGLSRVVHALQDHAELVAAESCRRVAGANHRLELHGERLQRRVPGMVPEPVVDALEVVEVDEQQGGLPPGPVPRRDRVLEPLGEVNPIRKPCERVVERLPAKAFLRFPLGGDVEQVALQMERLAFVVGDDHAFVADPDPPPVACPQAILDAQRLVCLMCPRVRGQHPVTVVRMEQLDEQRLVGLPVRDGVAEDLLDLAAREDVGADGVELVGVDHERQLLHESAVPPVDLAPLGGLALGSGDRPFALEHDARDAPRDIDQLEVALRRPTDRRVVERKRADHLVRAVEDRRRPAGAQPMLGRKVTKRLPERICGGVLDHHGLLAVDRRATRSGNRADRDAVDRLAVGGRQPRGDERAQGPGLRLDEEHRRDRVWRVGLDQVDEQSEHVARLRPGGGLDEQLPLHL